MATGVAIVSVRGTHITRDESGRVEACATDVGPRQQWDIVSAPAGGSHITQGEGYLATSAGEVRCVENLGPDDDRATWHVEGEYLKNAANGKYLCLMDDLRLGWSDSPTAACAWKMSGATKPCWKCGTEGHILCPRCHGTGTLDSGQPCDLCFGAEMATCPHCSGRGWL